MFVWNRQELSSWQSMVGEELEKLISEINTEFYNQKVMEIKQYLIGTNNLKENYRNIINKIRETG